MDRDVEGYFRGHPPKVRKLCLQLRSLILKECPGIGEDMWAGAPWYGRRFYIAAFRDHVNLGFPVEGLTEKEKGLFEGSGRFMRHIKLFPETGMDRKRILMLIKAAKKSRCSCP